MTEIRIYIDQVCHHVDNCLTINENNSAQQVLLIGPNYRPLRSVLFFKNSYSSKLNEDWDPADI